MNVFLKFRHKNGSNPTQTEYMHFDYSTYTSVILCESPNKRKEEQINAKISNKNQGSCDKLADQLLRIHADSIIQENKYKLPINFSNNTYSVDSITSYGSRETGIGITSDGIPKLTHYLEKR